MDSDLQTFFPFNTSNRVRRTRVFFPEYSSMKWVLSEVSATLSTLTGTRDLFSSVIPKPGNPSAKPDV